MNPYDRVAVIVDRIGFIGGANRARQHDAYRVEMNGGPPPQVEVRLEAVAQRLESIADDLEAAGPGKAGLPAAWPGSSRPGTAWPDVARRG